MIKQIPLVITLMYLILIVEKSMGQFNISAEIRPRIAIDNGAGVPLNDTLDTRYYATQRTRLSFDFQKSVFRLRLTAQDVRVWGSGDIYTSTGVFGSNSGLDFYEAWLKIRLSDATSVKIGRQPFAFDNERLISRRNWNQFGLAYDAVLLEHKQKSWTVDLALSYNNLMNYNTGGTDFSNNTYFSTNVMKTFNFLRVHKTFGDHFNTSLYAMASGFVNESNPGVIYLTGTYGLFAQLSLEQLEIPIDVYYQNGSTQSGKAVSAFMAGINPTVRISTVRLGLGADYLSGDDAGKSGYREKERTFNKFYGSGFRFHGWMNHYVYIKGSTMNGGLVDIYPSVSWAVNPRHKLDLLTHFFSLANPVMIGDMLVDDKNLGTELDTRYTFTWDSELSVNVGFSYYFTTDTFILVKTRSDAGIRQPWWIWTMLTYKPVIFKK